MKQSAPEKYRERLSALNDESVLRTVTDSQRPDMDLQRQEWRRSWGRIEPDEEPYATLLYETRAEPQTIFRADVYERRPTAQSADQVITRLEVAGWLRITPFPSDPALPTLATTLAEPGQHSVVRYRPFRRCTIRFVADDGVRFAKVFPDNRGAGIHQAGMALWQAARDDALGFTVARPDRWDARTNTLWQWQLSGEPVVEKLFGPEGSHLAHRLGCAAGSITGSKVRPDETFDSAAQLNRSRRCASDLSQRIPGLAEAAQSLIAKLSETQSHFSRRQLRPIHGAPHIHQWLENDDGLGLVDFDRIAWGDPELDAATFLAELGFEGRLQIPVGQLTEAFLDGYESAAGALDRRLFTSFLAQKRLAKARRTARAVRPDGDLRAAKHLEQAIQLLER